MIITGYIDGHPQAINLDMITGVSETSGHIYVYGLSNTPVRLNGDWIINGKTLDTYVHFNRSLIMGYIVNYMTTKK